jgi:hypothetical protein
MLLAQDGSQPEPGSDEGDQICRGRQDGLAHGQGPQGGKARGSQEKLHFLVTLTSYSWPSMPMNFVEVSGRLDYDAQCPAT